MRRRFFLSIRRNCLFLYDDLNWKRDMKRLISLCAALVALSLSAVAQNYNEAVQQAEEQVRQRQEALEEAQRVHQ